MMAMPVMILMGDGGDVPLVDDDEHDNDDDDDGDDVDDVDVGLY